MRIPSVPADFGHSYYKFYAFLRPEMLAPGWSRDRIIRALQAEGIPCGSGTCPEIYRERVFEELGLQPSHRLPVAKELGETSLMFQVHPTLTASEIEETVLAVDKVMRHAAVPSAAAQKAA
jgi:dTDP-4-amino-4,6-dideoxygalactose transaminase